MIRVNLLPTKRTQRVDTGFEGQSWLLAVVGVLVAQVLVFFFVYRWREDQLGQVQRKNKDIEAAIAEIDAQTAEHPKIKAELKMLRDREEAIQKLQSARTGPTSVMLELSRIMTEGRGPTIAHEKLDQVKKDSPQAAPNPAWDPRRLWLTGYQEGDRALRISGYARDGEDVSELLRRLTLSDYFYEVRLLPAQKTTDSVTKLEVVRFELSAKVRY